MAYPTEVDAVPLAPTSGALGSTSPTQSELANLARSAIRSIRDYIDAGPFIHVEGLVENSQAAAATNTALIQAAEDAAYSSSAVRSPLTGGGAPRGGAVVVIPPGHYYVQRNADGNWYSIKHRDGVFLTAGGWGARLTLKDGVITTTGEDTACSVIWFENPSSFAGVENIAVNGNYSGQTSTNTWSHGIDMRRDDVTDMYDGGLWLNHVLAWGCCGNGIMAGYEGGTRGNGSANTATIINCYAYHNQNNGFKLKTDQRILGCKAGNNAGNGFDIYASTSCLLTNCKGFGNSIDLRASYSEQLIADNFTSEDFKGGAGIMLTAMRASRVTGGIYRSMTTNPLGYNAGLWIEDAGSSQANPWHHERCHSLDIQLTCSFPNPGGNVVMPQKHLITRHLGAGINILLLAEPGTWTIERWQSLGGSTDGNVRFNSSNNGTVGVPYAASITPSADLGQTQIVGALTGNLTVNAPSYPVLGQRLTFNFTQDATGTRTVTFNSVFKKDGGTFTASTGNGAKCSITFEYDGTDWREVTRSMALA